MITQKVWFHRTFTPKFRCFTNEKLMTKTKYQEVATDYAHEYLEHLLKMEDILGRTAGSRNELVTKRNPKDKQQQQ